MNEFSKPFEYQDEDNLTGMPLILFFMLIFFEPFIGIITIFATFRIFKSGPYQSIFLVAIIIYIISSILAGVFLRLKLKIAPIFIKIFLIYRLILFIPYLYVNKEYSLSKININTTMDYQLEYDSIIRLYLEMVYLLAFSITWIIYLFKSEKIQSIINSTNV